MKLVFAQLRMELITLGRNYEQLLLVVAIPVGVLRLFGNVDMWPESGDLARVVSSVVALSVMSTAMVSLGIATGFERSYNVLKRIGVTPLGRHRLVWAKAGSVSVVELAQASLLLAIAAILGWSVTDVSWWRTALAMLLGTASFAGIGLVLAGRLRAEVNLAAQNGLYLLLLAVGGVMVPTSELPNALAAVAQLLPSGALANVLDETINGRSVAGDWWLGLSASTGAWVVLGVWAVVAPLAAGRLFRFDG
jgi:ABC-2 type transport system permease protein